MVDYSQLAQTAKSLITKFGKDWTHRSIVKGSYTPSTNTVAADTTTDVTVKAVKQDYNHSQVDGTIIKQGDVKLICEALTTEPTTHDYMVDGLEVWNIIKIKEINPGGTVVFYEMQLRK